MPWIDTASIEKPDVVLIGNNAYTNGSTIEMRNKEKAKKIKSFIVYGFNINDSTRNQSNPANIVKIIPAITDSIQYITPHTGSKVKRVAVSCIDFQNNESEMVFLKQK